LGWVYMGDLSGSSSIAVLYQENSLDMDSECWA
jgi:hypothetical protein